MGLDGMCSACRARAGANRVGAVLEHLGSGRTLDSGLRSRVEPVFGYDFSAVRVHSDATAASLSAGLDARAFTIGHHIALGPGEYQPGTSRGDALLAHELAHVMQQAGASRSAEQLRDGSPEYEAFENEADTAAAVALAGLRSGLTRAVAPTVPRRPAKFGVQRQPRSTNRASAASAHAGFWIWVTVEEPVTGEEFCIRTVMQGHAITREEAQRALKAGTLHCYGRYATNGVALDSIKKPIPMFVDSDPGAKRPDAPQGRDTGLEPEPGEKREVDDEANRRFWARIGGYRILSKDDPRDASYRELWKTERAAVLRERRAGSHPVSPGLGGADDVGGAGAEAAGRQRAIDDPQAELVQEVLDSPNMQRFMSVRAATPGRPSTRALQPGEMETLLEVSTEVDQMSDEDLAQYSLHARVGAGSWAETLADVKQFREVRERIREVRARDEQIKSTLNQDAALITLIAKHNRFPAPLDQAAVLDWIQNEKALESALEAKGFESLEQYEDVRAAPWREAFRRRAIEVANEALVRAGGAAYAMRVVCRDRSQVAALWTQLGQLRGGALGKDDATKLLSAYPILGHRKALDEAMKASDANDLGSRMGYFSLKMQVGTMDILDRLGRDPDRVFQMDAIVAATLDGMGLADDSPQAQAIREGLGRERQNAFLSALEGIADFLQYFIPGWGEVKGIANFLEAVGEYETETAEATASVRSEDPSLIPVVVSGVAAVAPFAAPPVVQKVLAPFARRAEPGLRAIGDLVGAETNAATRGGEDVAARVSQDVGVTAGSRTAGELSGPSLLETPVTVRGEGHRLSLIQTEHGPVWGVCTGCQPVADVIRELRATPGLSEPVANRLAELEDFAGRVTPRAQANEMRSLLGVLSEADHLVPPPGALGEGVRAGAAPVATAGAGATAAEIERRAAELQPLYERELRGSRRPVFRGRAYKGPLGEGIENEARARALAQAQEELRGRPLTLEPGAPARLNVDPATDIPFGFYDRPGFEQFSRRLYEPLRAVDKDAQLVLEGSGVTGRRFDRLISHEPTGAPFGVGRVSDYDVGIVSDQLLQRARQLRIPTSEPLTGAQLVALGLEDLASTSRAAVLDATGIPHAVNFKIYGSAAAASTRLPLPQ